MVPWCVREGRRKLGLGASRVALLFLSVCGELYLYSICQAGQLDTLHLLHANRMLLFFYGHRGYYPQHELLIGFFPSKMPLHQILSEEKKVLVEVSHLVCSSTWETRLGSGCCYWLWTLGFGEVVC